MRNSDGFPFNEEVEKGVTAIFHLPADGTLPSEMRMKRVFDLDSALVAGIINNALANAATHDSPNSLEKCFTASSIGASGWSVTP